MLRLKSNQTAGQNKVKRLINVSLFVFGALLYEIQTTCAKIIALWRRKKGNIYHKSGYSCGCRLGAFIREIRLDFLKDFLLFSSENIGIYRTSLLLLKGLSWCSVS
jgi:hypothetical protein